MVSTEVDGDSFDFGITNFPGELLGELSLCGVAGENFYYATWTNGEARK